MEPGCTCEYGYADTWQQRITDEKMKSTLGNITKVIAD